MSALFYDHLIKIHRLEQHLLDLQLEADELAQIEHHLDQLIQHRVIEVILDLLHQDHHHLFIAQLEQSPHDPHLLDWLKHHIHDIESHLTQSIHQLETELLQELKTLHN